MPTVFQPFDPEQKTRIRKRRFPLKKRAIPVRALIPNLFTLMALSAGLTAIRMGIEQRYELAIAAILIAAVLDALDGRVARMLDATSRFGAELDSLADFVNFGVAPAIIIFTWALDGLRSIGWIAVLIYALCAAMRLARFNVALDDVGEPRWKKNYFVGMPAPAAAFVVLLPLYVSMVGVPDVPDYTPVILIHVLFVALMMVSKIPTFSGKLLGGAIDREYVLPVFVSAVLLTALLFTYSWLMLIIGAIAYLAVIPYSYTRYRRREAMEQETASPDESGKNAETADDGEEAVAEASEESTGQGEESKSTDAMKADAPTSRLH